jgi:hypothetical protein
MSATALVFSDHDRTDPLGDACVALVSALARVGEESRAAAWQDGLDLLAVIAGLKPVCLVGRGWGDDAWRAAVRAVARDAALPAIDAQPWEPAGNLPDWYREATTRRRARHGVLYLCRDDAMAHRVAALSARGRVPVEAEASVLGYPSCCVGQHHARSLEYERLLAERTARLARGDRARMMRLVETGTEPGPTTRAEWEQIETLTRIAPAPSTSVNMCDPCARDPASPALRLARAYAGLAERAGYPAR